MSYSHTFVDQIQTAAGSAIAKTNSYSAGMLTGLDEAVPAAGSTTFLNFDVDVSEVESVFISCDRAVTVLVNDDGTPDATIALLADKPLIWRNDGYFSNPLGSVDITSLKVTVPSGDAANFRIEVLQDPTP